MKNWKKLLGLGLSAALMVGALAGCTSNGDGQPTGTPSPTASAAVDEVPLVATEDSVQAVVGIPGDTVMFTVNGENITAAELYYWIAASVERVGYYNFGSVDAIDWTAEQDGQTIAAFILEDAKQTAMFYRLIEIEAKKAGITMSDENKAELQDQIGQYVAQLGEDGYANRLQQICLSDEEFRHMMEISYLYTDMQDYLYGENGQTPPTSEELIAKAEDEGLMLAKHILIKTVDAAGTELSEEEQAAAKTKAEGLLTQLRAVEGDEQQKLFDQLMEENSEDGRNTDGTLAAPDGYLFGTGEMVQEFEDATAALEYNQISDLVKTSYGYHIILRLPPDNADMRDKWVSAKMEETTDSWLSAAQVVDSDEMGKIDVKAFYDALTTYRASLTAAEATPTPTETAPTETTPAATTTPSPTN
ncbi:PPIC-type PPIASE domain protein [uncultured Eubacteriales bacterium]|uniref:PPIC-type PPIASE domain protein n=1 Tax=uncultured Eubacteriales bacterium TaxID=172733 RepID=A0A212KLT1_9FIRM|nr:PPIC-type PPIASE domain protein [uncultured Eubacteriales bacterium]